MSENNTFEEYWRKNPRSVLPDDMKLFIEYAKKQYEKLPDRIVNMTHGLNDVDELHDEVENYLGDCIEALYLFKEFSEDKDTKIIIQKEISIDEVFIAKAVEHYIALPKDFGIGMIGEIHNRDEIIFEIAKLSNFGKMVLLSRYKFLEWEKQNEAKRD